MPRQVASKLKFVWTGPVSTKRQRIPVSVLVRCLEDTDKLAPRRAGRFAGRRPASYALPRECERVRLSVWLAGRSPRLVWWGARYDCLSVYCRSHASHYLSLSLSGSTNTFTPRSDYFFDRATLRAPAPASWFLSMAIKGRSVDWPVSDLGWT